MRNLSFSLCLRGLSVLLFGLVVASMSLTGCGEVSVSQINGCETCPERCVRNKEGTSGKCAECLNDGHCTSDTSPTKKCLANKCVCGTDQDCGGGQICSGDNTKGEGGCVDCTTNDHCKEADKTFCLFNECVACEPGGVKTCEPQDKKACKKGSQQCRNSGDWGECEGWTVCKDTEKCVDEKCVPDCPEPAPCDKEGIICESKSDEVPGRFKTCKKNERGCFELSAKEDFCGPKEYCAKGECLPYDCPKPDCSLDETRCVNEASYRICVKDKNGCLGWSDPKTCEDQKKCRLSTNRCVVCDPGTKQSCYTGADGTKNKGICRAGEQVCASDGTKWEECKDQVIPAPETCNGQDDDCDGQIDNSIATPEPCDNQTGDCKGAVKRCGGAQGWIACAASDYRSQYADYEEKETKCDGKDNDCDGQVDNIVTAPECTNKAGVCAGAKQKCDGANGWIDCDEAAYKAHSAAFETKEISCDNKDNDCDGSVDEDVKRQCYEGANGCTKTSLGLWSCKGACKPGVETCQNGQWGTCIGQVKDTTETCNGKDDDCDGNVDEGNPGGGGACSVPGKKGICVDGTWACISGVRTCKQTINPTRETCNGKDDDCDGNIDESLSRTCYTGPAGTLNVGACRRGTQTCSAGRWGSCTGQVTPKSETCDGKDNDCDGTTDESAYCPRGSACASGTCKVCTQPKDGECPEFLGGCTSNAPCPSCKCGLSCYCKQKSNSVWCTISSGCCAIASCR